MSSVQQLYRLQLVDSEIAQKKRRLAEVVHQQRETGDLLAARQRFAHATDEVAQWTARQTDLNLELGAVNEKAKRSNQRLYSGKVTNPKELEDLQHEVEALGRRRASLEDEILETMIMLEDGQAELAAAKKALAEIETDWQKKQASLQEEQGELALSLHELLTARKKQEERIDAALLAKYETIRARKNGVAVAELVNGTCMGCHVGMSAQRAKQVERGEIVTCGGCGRILYLR